MKPARLDSTLGFAICLFALLTGPALTKDDSVIRCHPFFEGGLADPAPREAASVIQRFEAIKSKVQSHSYQVLFLGDSLTHRWDEVPENHTIWMRNFDRFDALNAGINGDRTEHLLWRIQQGNLDNQKPRVIVLLIGTNDLGHGRSPEEVAEGIRRVLLKLREMLPETRILLEGLWPRTDRARFGTEIAEVNRRIKQCSDNVFVVYIEPGRRLLDRQGRLPRDRAPDGLHPNAAGYEIVSPEIAQPLAALLRSR